MNIYGNDNCLLPATLCGQAPALSDKKMYRVFNQYKIKRTWRVLLLFFGAGNSMFAVLHSIVWRVYAASVSGST